jgi:DNA-binding NarL/FixJ family response regulator
VRRPGLYRLTWRAQSGKATLKKAGLIRFVGPGIEQFRTRPHRVEVVLAVDTSKGARRISSSADRVVSHATPERTFALLSAQNHTVNVVVVDVDRFGIRFLRDLRTVFPTVRVVVLSDRRPLRGKIKRAGAFSILPRSATQPQLSRAIRIASATLPKR